MNDLLDLHIGKQDVQLLLQRALRALRLTPLGFQIILAVGNGLTSLFQLADARVFHFALAGQVIPGFFELADPALQFTDARVFRFTLAGHEPNQ